MLANTIVGVKRGRLEYMSQIKRLREDDGIRTRDVQIHNLTPPVRLYPLLFVVVGVFSL